MKLNTKMPKTLLSYYNHEIERYYEALKSRNTDGIWFHLERAHIIAQPYPWPHSVVHWKMLCQGIREKRAREIVGQMIRLLLGGLLSFINQIPKGNVGSSRVQMTKSQEIPNDIRLIFHKSENN